MTLPYKDAAVAAVVRPPPETSPGVVQVLMMMPVSTSSPSLLNKVIPSEDGMLINSPECFRLETVLCLKKTDEQLTEGILAARRTFLQISRNQHVLVGYEDDCSEPEL